ncbi:DDE-type integrase/transposase/recombinase [Fodinisporobacter ferrooxydans]|uniref:DDE-type integrase/transposase/recombinase n=1 Tax=Fodinisporobacter ferrooxydans TaxID=2901836 RepID=A0ABY4CEW8_9BACL|nr:DDE-type integrase/transposase/recombinase [Alicyclobacillaceae bacterium MYW30-H2]UOF90077.1 DDE-type integrase/transposase/recombinase [Alicyclobacillaceae bacterium MYW30-H2]UOF90812.1 DDE-type integrase/transposase/recombinase [Alicyclobacillaceae bacterium MYW30-H2]UOF91036.1 DDE-type integrase/transposase/recombinase [Alicyclobacillaceae bacterium MYW30-H2]UOF91462.1 DDE-type integrase/transposase/recombinase [Alicyclobacillaceae bacterium MYW30-H2]
MDEQNRERVALFRYGIIAPLLNEQVDRATYLAEVSAKTHEVPYYGSKEFTPKTILAWLRQYRRNGFDALKPQARSDRGQSRSLSGELQLHLVSLRKENQGMPVTVFYDQLVQQGEILPQDVSYTSIYRLLKKEGLLGKGIVRSPERKRFSHDTVNMLWQTDLSDGPYLRTGDKKIKTYLIAVIDDCSRLCTFAQFVPSEKFDGLRTVLKEALLRRGIPKMLYTDNGKIFRSDTLHLACAELGIHLLHTQPYDAASKGKIERLFGTIKTRFYSLLKAKPASSLEELNERFWKWLEEDYHRKPHSSLNGKMPLEVYLSQIDQVRMVDDPAKLDPIFLKRENRTVKHDGTFSLNNQLYEVPERFIGQKIEIRYDEQGVHIYEDGKPVARASEVNFHDNAHVKRKRPAISFADMQGMDRKGEDRE